MPNSPAPPDIVLIGATWPARALLRAQLKEEGYEVVATDAWPIPRQFLCPGIRPGLIIVDLQDLPGMEQALSELRSLMRPDRVLVVTALGTPTPDEIRTLGFRVMARPVTIEEIVRTAAEMLRREGNC